MKASQVLRIAVMVIAISLSRVTFGWTMKFYDPGLMAED